MIKLTRREWHKLVTTGVLSSLASRQIQSQVRRQESRIAGVLIGIQSYSFRDRDLQGLIDGMVATGLTSCELWEAHVEPRELRGPDTREQLRRWRLTAPLSYFHGIRDRFTDAGLTLNSYNLSFKAHFSDEEINRGFEMAKALGVSAITSSAQVNSVPRIARMASDHGIPVAIHNHSDVDPNEFSSPEQFAAAMELGDGRSITVNLDVGHFTAANHDAVAYLRANRAHITTIHLKDRQRNEGPNVPWGDGDAPLDVVLRMLRDEQWGIPANIEYEYRGNDTVEEVQRCFDYCRRVLEA